MIHVRRSEERGHAQHGWLDSYHSFSFADYFDREHMGFRTLRVINEDRVQPGEGFPTHGHRDMEILTYVIEGELHHRDSMGSEGKILPGDVQIMSAGRGVTHSEFNGSREKSLHLLQIWVLPESNGLEPRYEQKHFSQADKRDRLCLIASRSASGGSLRIFQDAKIFASQLARAKEASYELSPERHAWVQLISGSLRCNGETLRPGDAVALSGEKKISFRAEEESEFLLFDLS